VCRTRFAGRPARFDVNDGKTLPMIADASIDAAFSFDSLVHVDAPEVLGYLHEAARCLRPGGVGFFHHSNLGAYANRATGALPFYVSRKGWRSPTMSARAFRDGCREAGLECLCQEVITWRIRGNRQYQVVGERLPLSDCFSVFARRLRPGAPEPTKVYVNQRFVEEWDQLTLLGELYVATEPGSSRATAASHARDGHEVPAVPVAQASDAVSEAPVRRTISRAAGTLRTTRARLMRRVLAQREPFVKPLRARCCPDCSRALVPEGVGGLCDACNVIFISQ
jgi:hypothetical protein